MGKFMAEIVARSFSMLTPGQGAVLEGAIPTNSRIGSGSGSSLYREERTRAPKCLRRGSVMG